MSDRSWKAPPPFGDDGDYESWKSEVEIWRCITDLDKKKQALAIILSLSGRPKQLALQCPTESFKVDDGVDILLAELDKTFKREEADCAYESFSRFEKFTKSSDHSMSAYIIEFERLYNKAKQYKMCVPDAILAYKLLENASLDARDRQMVLSACGELKFDKMSSLRRIFGEGIQSSSGTVKEEPVFYGGSFKQSRGRGNWRRNSAPYPRSWKSFGAKQGRNPVGKDGNVTRCSICESVNHYQRNCPDKVSSNDRGSESADIAESIEEEVNIVLYNHRNDREGNIQVAIVDTACTANVCGESWFEEFCASYTTDPNIETKESSTKFVFGGGEKATAFCRAKLPVQINGYRCFIETDVIRGDLPLLLSKASLKKMAAVIDTGEDTIKVFDDSVPFKLNITKSGHYAIPLTFSGCGKPVTQKQLETAESADSEIAFKTSSCCALDDISLIKLHRQLGHCSPEMLQALLKDAGLIMPDLWSKLSKIHQNCDICKLQSKKRPVPCVGMPLSSAFNDVLAMDLHQVANERSTWFLHMIDEFSRFSVAVIITDKKAETIIQGVVRFWFLKFGPPRKIHVDNGGEFNNDSFRKLCDQHGIRLLPSPAYSPWSNGTCERHNGIITEMLKKILMDRSDISLSTALDHAVYSKNCLLNKSGFSPYQIVFGKNPRIPGVPDADLPALESKQSMPAIVAKHISLLESSRAAFAKAEASDRIGRALLKNVRSSEGPFATGESVFYRREGSSPWQGPATVLAQNGQEVIVKHGGQTVATHCFRLCRVSDQRQGRPETSDECCPKTIPQSKPENEPLPTFTDDSDEEYIEKASSEASQQLAPSPPDAAAKTLAIPKPKSGQTVTLRPKTTAETLKPVSLVPLEKLQENIRIG